MRNLIDLIKEYTSEPVPVQIEYLIRDLGIELNKKAELDPDIAGQIELENGRYKISINRNDHYFRQRFTMAHELGHYIFHRELLDSGCIVDNRLYRNTNSSAQVTELHESEANHFAANLLMPLHHIKKDFEEALSESLPEEKALARVAAKWQVSPAAMRIQLGLRK
ncbi:MAG: ImmA/IrrE family metallo-endopeptidase [Candidatus Melainabacteria bacterium]|nr:ImmA/IrrE family metallo-endopeptidase [Candidatus Melainabacteria bacterium]